ncbi:MAG: hypothetical protein WD512_03710 [Candidatus Paceibacterota bacterium]
MRKFLLMLLSINLSIRLFADIAPNPIFVNGLIPADSCKVQMVSEIVNAWVYKDSSVIECYFVLKNHSSKTTLSVGFPIMSFYHWQPPENWIPEKENFKVTVGNEMIVKFDRYIPNYVLYQDVKMNQMDSIFNIYFKSIRDSLHSVYPICSRKDELKFYKRFDKVFENVPNEKDRIELKRKLDFLIDYEKTPWYLWNISLDSAETKIVKVKYNVPCGLGYGARYRYFKYIISTGAGWYGKIENAKINVTLMDFNSCKVDSINPSQYIFDKRHKTITWDLNNIEPTIKDNIYVEYSFGREKSRYWYHRKFKFYVFGHWLSPRYWIYCMKENKKYKEKCK